MIHGIPVVIWVTADTRETAVKEVLDTLGDEVASTLPNDMPAPDMGEGVWHLEWVRGPAPEPLSEEFSFIDDRLVRREDG